MKKAFFLLAAMCCMMVSAQTFTITYTPQDGSPITLSEGTHNLGDRRGTVTIQGNDITFDNAAISCDEGFRITPSDLSAKYVLKAHFKGYNSIGSEQTPALEFMGNPSKVIMDGDVLRAWHYNNDCATILTHSGSIHLDILELFVYNVSSDHYTIEMGDGEYLELRPSENYCRVNLYNAGTRDRALKASPFAYGDLNLYDESWETATDVYYATANSRNILPAYLGGTRLNEGNLPYLSRLAPGLKSGTITAENHVAESGSFFHFNIKDVVIEAVAGGIFSTRDANLVLNVEGTNSITSSYELLESEYYANDMRGNLKVVGKGTDAQLILNSYDERYATIRTQGYASFENLTVKAYANIEHSNANKKANVIRNEREGGESDFHELIIKKNAKVLLAQRGDISDQTPDIIYGFTKMSGSASQYFTDPIYGSFINGNFYAEDGETPLHEVYFDSEDYHIVLNESTPVCSLNAEDVMHNGRVRYEDNTLFVNDFDLDDIVADNTLNLSGNNSEIRAIYATDLRITGSSDFSVLDEILTEKITFENTNFNLYGEINNLDEVPTLVGCHALEYDDFKLEGGVLYGINGATSEVVESLTIVNDMTGIHNSHVTVPATKTIENDQVVIIRGGKKFNLMGAEL